MRTLKKLTGVLLALIMAFGLTCIASAATYTITIDNDEAGYQYTAYQVFSGDVSTLNGTAVLTNLNWGQNVTAGTNLDRALQAISVTINGETVYPFADIATSGNSFEVILNVLASYADEDDNVVAQAFAEVMRNYVGSAIATSTTVSPLHHHGE
ncbi:MAG: hypothetical protein LUI14_08920 [Lachnospiraceae bacterium]|nr:hypothetical protein [Lachnospiraceae bacterium]